MESEVNSVKPGMSRPRRVTKRKHRQEKELHLKKTKLKEGQMYIRGGQGVSFCRRDGE